MLVSACCQIFLYSCFMASLTLYCCGFQASTRRFARILRVRTQGCRRKQWDGSVGVGWPGMMRMDAGILGRWREVGRVARPIWHRSFCQPMERFWGLDGCHSLHIAFCFGTLTWPLSGIRSKLPSGVKWRESSAPPAYFPALWEVDHR